MASKSIFGALSDDDTKGRRHALGVAGERLAAEFLEHRGLTVLVRNWRCDQGELDIVAADGQTVVFCEVKARSGPDYGAPLNAVSPHKARHLRMLASIWLAEWRLVGAKVRFDVVSVLWPPGRPAHIEYLEGAF
ncbi:YraN family protein [Saccharopolyspora taberi]|uniref:UPF0102 protein GCM10010470_12010 n=1 Tax=Saccharopolyspora taberi TaxID=60895 RepID=A0ABN3V5Y8_9PSEU